MVKAIFWSQVGCLGDGGSSTLTCHEQGHPQAVSLCSYTLWWFPQRGCLECVLECDRLTGRGICKAYLQNIRTYCMVAVKRLLFGFLIWFRFIRWVMGCEPSLQKLDESLGLVEVGPASLRALGGRMLGWLLPWNLSEQFLCSFHGFLWAMYTKGILFKLFHR